MAADAWYVSLGYELADRPWRPSLTYRYAVFEGDDPTHADYERFDAPQSSGSDNWLQGNIFKKTVVNSNLKSHRVRLAAGAGAAGRARRSTTSTSGPTRTTTAAAPGRCSSCATPARSARSSTCT